MNKKLALLSTTALLAFSAPSFAADKETVKTETKIERDGKGNYESKTTAEQTDLSGTKVTEDSKVSVKVDSDGNVKKTVQTETTKDPKGLVNKTTAKTTDTVETVDGVNKAHHKKTVDGEVTEEIKTTH